MSWLREIVAKNLFDLPLPERLKRYRELAVEAEAFSATMITPALRDGYRNIARHWTEMAENLEEFMRHEPSGEKPAAPSK